MLCRLANVTPTNASACIPWWEEGLEEEEGLRAPAVGEDDR